MIVRVGGVRINFSQIVRFLILAILAIIWLVPMAWLVMTSLKPESQIIELPPR